MPRILATPHEFGLDLIQALGLQSRSITSITLRVTHDRLPQVRITENLIEDEGKKISKLTKRYTLVPAKG